MSLVNNSDKELTDDSLIPDYKASVGVAMQNPNLAREKSLREAMNFLGINSPDNKLAPELASLYNTLEGKVIKGEPLTGYQKTIYGILRDKITGNRDIVNEFGSAERYGISKTDVETNLSGIFEILVKMDPDMVESMFTPNSGTLADIESLLLTDPNTISVAYGISSEEASTLIASGVFHKELAPELKEALLNLVRSIKETKESEKNGTAK